MKLFHRFAWPLIGATIAISFGFGAYHGFTEAAVLQQTFEANAGRITGTLRASMEAMLEHGSGSTADRLLSAFKEDGVTMAAAVFSISGQPVVASPQFNERAGAGPEALGHTLRAEPLQENQSGFVALGRRLFYTSVLLHHGSDPLGRLAVLFNPDHLNATKKAAWIGAFRAAAVESLLFTAVILLLLQFRVNRPLADVIAWARRVRYTDREQLRERPAIDESFHPLVSEFSKLAANWHEAMASADHEARLRDTAESVWTRDRLRVYLERTLEGSRLFVISNRQPYEHVLRDGKVQVRVPASGLVTAMEPILQACDGTWIAHGAGSADRSTVDAHDHLAVPPDSPRYTLRRVWLTQEEENGYYYGFSNEGLWPLCHVAHTRPLFRREDWIVYQEVNRKFAEAALEEMKDCPNPLVLVQDYHFALLPQLIKQRRPDARVAIFWHIPWPNPDAFGICPWQAQLLEGLLGADVVGFHTQSHCNHFLQTVDRVLECRVEFDRKGVTRGDRFTAVRPFPISVEFGPPNSEVPEETDYVARGELLAKFGDRVAFLGVGVDRLDYTKGIPERFLAIERFLEENPLYKERLTFVQIGAPTRSNIRRYQEIVNEIRAEAARINQRFATRNWSPIVLFDRHHPHEAIVPYYKFADFCMVTSLDDGMNLVSKEYIASRADENGALVLSRFTGAAQELEEALIVNPYDVEEVARSIRHAIEMSHDERRRRMRRMRRTVRERNIYWWAAELVGAVADVRCGSAAAGTGGADRTRTMEETGRFRALKGKETAVHEPRPVPAY